MSTPTSGPSGPLDPPPPPSAGPWASDNLPQHPMSGYSPEPVERPQSIVTAVKLMYVGAGIALVSTLFTLTQSDAMRDAIEDSDSTLTSSEVDTLVSSFMVMGVVIGLIGVGIWIWMAAKNGQGRSWARVVATVLGVLNIVFTLLSLVQSGSTPGTIAFNVVSIILAGVILFLLYRPESTRFYDFASRR